MNLPRTRLRLVVPGATVVAAVALAACGSSGPSVSAGQAASTTSTSVASSTTTTSTTTPSATTTPTTAVPANLQQLSYQGLVFEVPKAWPVYNLASDPTRCVRYDQNAVYLGQQGPTPKCPANPIGHTDTVQVAPINSQTQSLTTPATQATTINGLAAKVDPNATTNGAYTIVFPSLQLVAVVTISTPPMDLQIVASFQHAGAAAAASPLPDARRGGQRVRAARRVRAAAPASAAGHGHRPRFRYVWCALQRHDGRLAQLPVPGDRDLHRR